MPALNSVRICNYNGPMSFFNSFFRWVCVALPGVCDCNFQTVWMMSRGKHCSLALKFTPYALPHPQPCTHILCKVLNPHYNSSALFTALLSLVSVTCSQPRSENMKWKIPYLNNLYVFKLLGILNNEMKSFAVPQFTWNVSHPFVRLLHPVDTSTR